MALRILSVFLVLIGSIPDARCDCTVPVTIHSTPVEVFAHTTGCHCSKHDNTCTSEIHEDQQPGDHPSQHTPECPANTPEAYITTNSQSISLCIQDFPILESLTVVIPRVIHSLQHTFVDEPIVSIVPIYVSLRSLLI